MANFEYSIAYIAQFAKGGRFAPHYPRLAIITSKCNRKYVMWLSLPPTTNTNRY